MWRHLRMLKRGGRSYDATGIDGTSPGELAVLCPACPIPSVNLPPNWESAGKDLEYMNMRPESNFLLKRRVLGISITKPLALMLASASKGGKPQTTRGIRSWVQDLHTSLCGTHIASTSDVLPIK